MRVSEGLTKAHCQAILVGIGCKAKVAVGTNAKVAIAAFEEGPKSWIGAVNCAFRGGAVTGLASCSIAIAVLSGARQIY